jgi:putative addiction module CopG family antidote
MSIHISDSVEKLIRQKMASGRFASEDELLMEALRSIDETDEDLRAIEESLDAFRQGERGVSVDEAFRRLREKHQIRE